MISSERSIQLFINGECFAMKVWRQLGICIGLAVGLAGWVLPGVVTGNTSMLNAAEFRVGAAKGEVTPTEPVPMWGYGDRHGRLSEGVLEPLLATAIVIQAGDTKLAIVGLDLGRSPSEASLAKIRQQIKERAGIEHAMLAGSHTHNGPVLELSDSPGRGRGRFEAALRYYQQLEQKLVDIILEADAQLAPALLASGSVQLDNYNRNRHSKIEPVPVDRGLGVIRFDSAESGQPIAVLVNFAAHPTSIPSTSMQFSPDYIGALREQVESQLGGVAVFMQGASGDLSTNRGPFGDHNKYGQALGQQAFKLAASLEPQPVAAPSLKVTEERFTFESRTDFRNPIVQTVYSVAFFPDLVANFIDEYADGIRPRLTVALLNDEIALVGGSGEFFCQHALRLRERAPVKQLMFFGYCNGYHQYFPTIEGAAEGGYGGDAQVAPAQVGAGEQMMNTALIRIYQMLGRL
jgi:neutral ceramidase